MTRPRILWMAAAAAGLIFAQTAKRPLSHKDYDGWRTITGAQLSRDGKWLAYSYLPQEGDGDLVVREIATGKEYKLGVGALPPAPVINPAEMNPEAEPPRRGITIRITSDAKFVIASTYPTKAETEAAKKARRRPDEMPKGGMLIVDLASGQEKRVAEVKSFQVPEKGGAWLAYSKEARPEPRPAEAAKPAAAAKPGDLAADEEDQRGGRGGAGAAGAGGARRDFGTDLVLRDLLKGDAGERTFANVAEYSFARDGKTLVYAVNSRKEEENGVFGMTPGNDAAPVALLAGKGRYSRISWDREQTQMAFVSSKDDPEARQPKFKVYGWDRKAAAAAELVSQSTPGFPAKFVVSDRGTLGFSRDGKKLYLSAALPPKPEREGEGAAPAAGAATPAPAAAADDKVLLDLWHWKDDQVQPIQRIRANQERNRTYRGVYHLADKKYVQVADERLPAVTPNDAGTLATGGDDRPYRRMTDYDGSYNDILLVDTATGARKQLVRQLRGGGGPFGGGGMQWAPDGQSAMYFNSDHWYVVRMADTASRNLTGSLGVKFSDEEDDTPDPESSYGNAGWTKDSKSFLVYDRYDVWQLDAAGGPARNLTGGLGRKERIQFRVQRIEPVDEDDDERGVDLTRPLTLRAVSEETRDSGFYRVRPGAGPERLLWGARSYQFSGRARDAEVLLVSASRFDEYPDLHVTNANFSSLKKVTDGGAQLAPFLWGKAETIRFRSTDGAPLKGTLYKPENFDPSKKYPLMIYIYERLSQGLHGFTNPQPGTSINISYYVSNGYLVLTPDIVYTIGYPGQSALKCVLPAIDKVVEMGIVNEDAIGIQGHSWGGYQIAYMVTQTTRFRAAEAGAPVGNMTSAYSGIRWGSGMPRQFQYEQTQSRIGHPLYQNPLRFLENSPIFYATRVKTPLLMVHNDQDDAVPWYQGIEIYLALRRHQKETYLFNYNGEFHGLRRRHNQKDWTVRMQQFFDHHLKGAPAPEWMEKGVSYIDREDEKERFNKATDQ